MDWWAVFFSLLWSSMFCLAYLFWVGWWENLFIWNCCTIHIFFLNGLLCIWSDDLWECVCPGSLWRGLFSFFRWRGDIVCADYSFFSLIICDFVMRWGWFWFVVFLQRSHVCDAGWFVKDGHVYRWWLIGWRSDVWIRVCVVVFFSSGWDVFVMTFRRVLWRWDW